MEFGGRRVDLSDLRTPADQAAVTRTFESAEFEVREAETLKLPLHFETFDNFMDFAYRGSWLTPFIEDLGLHHAGYVVRSILNRFVFPMSDHHAVVVGLARKPA